MLTISKTLLYLVLYCRWNLLRRESTRKSPPEPF